MTVAELIEALKGMPQDAVVVFPMDSGLHFLEPARVGVIRGFVPLQPDAEGIDADFFENHVGPEIRVAIDLGETDPA